MSGSRPCRVITGRLSAAFAAVVLLVPAPVTAVQPELPRAYVDTSPPPRSGRTIFVPRGGNFQAALDAANPGDVIVLEAGATYMGPFVLPTKPGSGWIIVRSSTPDPLQPEPAAALGPESGGSHRLPPPGSRLDPSFAPLMPKLVSRSGAVLRTAPGAHHYRFIGIEIHPVPGVFVHSLIELGANERNKAALPHDIIFDRCYIHGDPTVGGRRGIALNSKSTAVIESYLADFKEVGADSQAIAGWNGPGPFKLVNNYLEGAGENLIFGGADPSIVNLVPADIEIRRNHFFKPLAWRIGDPSYARTPWTVKNLFELKNARRVLVDGNVFEHNWVHAQNGFAILFTVRNQNGTAPWSVVEDVTFTNNVVRHSPRGINIHGFDDNFPSQQTRRILIKNNLIEDIVAARWGGGCCAGLLLVGNGTADVIVEHNTAFHADNVITAAGAPHIGFVYRNNIAPHNEYGIVGAGTGVGTPTLERYFPAAVIRRNVIVGGSPRHYPPDNLFPRSFEEVGFVDRAGGNYRLARSSPYKGAGTDGGDMGADFDALSRAMGSGPSVPASGASGLAPLAASGGAQTLSALGAPTTPRVDSDERPLGLRRVLEGLLWMCLALLGYVCVGYPALVRLWAAMRSSPACAGSIEPAVSVVVVARDEAANIEGRLQNLLTLDYPNDRIEIFVASDGSRDGTVERARSYEAAGVTVIAFEQRRGKPTVLNAVVPKARGEIVVLADTRQRFEDGALRALVRPFADPHVGAVSGELLLIGNAGGTAVGEGVGFYWRYEKFLRRYESRLDSTVGVTGAIYAIRRELFEPIPEDTILDDVLIPMRIAARGYRVLFEPGARAYDRAAATASEEFARKVRTMAGNFQLFVRDRWLLNPCRNRLWFQTLSHKGLRLLGPFLLAGAFSVNLALVDLAAYRWLLLAQGVFYAAALAGRVLSNTRFRFAPLSAPYVFCLLHWAVVVGFLRFITGRQRVAWDRAR